MHGLRVVAVIRGDMAVAFLSYKVIAGYGPNLIIPTMNIRELLGNPQEGVYRLTRIPNNQLMFIAGSMVWMVHIML